jgi:anti-sigma regulatory factor (Ser/Thr protein kinase)
MLANTMADSGPSAEGLTHLALLYGSTQEYLAGVLTFLRTSVRRAEPSFVAVPAPKVDLLRQELNGESAAVLFADMFEFGRNPARIIPRVRAFIDDYPGQRVSYVGEPIWPARSAAELREATRHEALVNLAFSGTAATILCPYDTAALAPSVIADAWRTHPALLRRGQWRVSPEYRGPASLPPACERPLPPPPPGAESITFRHDLRTARGMVISYASRAGATEDTIADLVLAVGEIAANTLRHTDGSGTLHIWHTADEILCQLDDQGLIANPLVGRLRPAPDALGGHGLWLVNQICDLVELRSGRAGTSIRLHMRRS